MPCNKTDKPLVVYNFTGNVMTSITTLDCKPRILSLFPNSFDKFHKDEHSCQILYLYQPFLLGLSKQPRFLTSVYMSQSRHCIARFHSD